MGISLKPQHLNRYRQIAWIFMKYGRSDLVQTTGLSATLEPEQRVAPAEAAKATELAADLEKLGPSFVKLVSCSPPESSSCPPPISKR